MALQPAMRTVVIRDAHTVGLTCGHPPLIDARYLVAGDSIQCYACPPEEPPAVSEPEPGPPPVENEVRDYMGDSLTWDEKIAVGCLAICVDHPDSAESQSIYLDRPAATKLRDALTAWIERGK